MSATSYGGQSIRGPAKRTTAPGGVLTSVENTVKLESRTSKMSDNSSCPIASPIHTEPFSEYYEVEEQIGRGKFAVVKRCRHKQTGHQYAAKFLRKRRKGKDCRHEILHEVAMLEVALEHPQLIDLVEVYETRQELILVTDYASGGELHHHVISEDFLPESDVKPIMKQILGGLCFLHEKDIVHLDIKPQNILLTKPFPHGDVKLCDFGFARKITKDEDVLDIIGTPDYVSPEVLSYEPIQTAADIWSVGVVAYVLLTGYSPFACDDKQETFLNISTVNLDFPEDLFDRVSQEAQDFITTLLVRNPAHRPTARECLSHPWLCPSSLSVPETLTSSLAETAIERVSSPAGSRRALIPSTPDSSLELEEPSKRCRCENDNTENQDPHSHHDDMSSDLGDSSPAKARPQDVSSCHSVRDSKLDNTKSSDTAPSTATTKDKSVSKNKQHCLEEDTLILSKSKKDIRNKANGIIIETTNAIIINKDAIYRDEKTCITQMA